MVSPLPCPLGGERLFIVVMRCYACGSGAHAPAVESLTNRWQYCLHCVHLGSVHSIFRLVRPVTPPKHEVAIIRNQTNSASSVEAKHVRTRLFSISGGVPKSTYVSVSSLQKIIGRKKFALRNLT